MSYSYRYKLVGCNICNDWKICYFCFFWNGMAVHHGSLPYIHKISRSEHEFYVRQIGISPCFICWNVGEEYHLYLPPANEICKVYVFTPVCLSKGGWGHVWWWWWWGAVCGGGACVAGGHAWPCTPPPRKILRDMVIWSMSGRYASYWNAFLLN